MRYLDKKELEYTIDFVSKLSKGIDPISSSKLPEDTVLNNRKYLQVFSYTEEALCYLLKNLNNIGPRSYNTKPEFYLSEKEKQRIIISKELLSISQITYNINSIADTSKMKKIKATQITSWLTELGYLQEDPKGETSHKVCTEKATAIGISTVEKKNSYNETYYVTLYGEMAQALIIQNINQIAQSY